MRQVVGMDNAMPTKYSLIISWLIAHRSQLQLVLITIIIALALLGVLAPQMRMLADGAPGGGH